MLSQKVRLISQEMEEEGLPETFVYSWTREINGVSVLQPQLLKFFIWRTGFSIGKSGMKEEWGRVESESFQNDIILETIQPHLSVPISDQLTRLLTPVEPCRSVLSISGNVYNIYCVFTFHPNSLVHFWFTQVNNRPYIYWMLLCSIYLQEMDFGTLYNDYENLRYVNNTTSRSSTNIL